MDGKDLTQLNVTSYRSHVALVSQEPTLYAGTVRFNIVLGHTKPESEITDEEIHAACRKANIHDYIMGLPDAYDTQVGAKGTAMSGGQKCVSVRESHHAAADTATAGNASRSQERSSGTRSCCCWTRRRLRSTLRARRSCKRLSTRLPRDAPPSPSPTGSPRFKAPMSST